MGSSTNPILKPVLSLLALTVAFVFTFITPEPVWWELIVAALAVVFGEAVIVDWRSRITQAKEWMESKTLGGVLLFGIPAVILISLQLIGVNVGDTALWISGLVALVGYILQWAGVIDAKDKPPEG